MAGAPHGNKNAVKGKDWQTALKYVLDNYEHGTIKKGLALRGIAHTLITKAIEGDIQAIKEIGDRLDGKPSQAIVGDPERPLIQKIEQIIVDAQGTSTP